jgi:hypothetical protein
MYTGPDRYLTLSNFLYSQELRTQLNQEREATRHATLSKDLELKEIRAQIDKTVRRYQWKCV